MDFEVEVARLGFHNCSKHNGRGGRLMTMEPNRFLTYTLHIYDDGTVLFSWEFAIGEYLQTRGLQLGTDETLSEYLFPRRDERGPQDPAWVRDVVERTEGLLRSVRLDAPESVPVPDTGDGFVPSER